MSHQEDIYTAIQAASAVTDIVGARVYPDAAPGNAIAPFIVYQSISTDGTTTHDGALDVVHPLIQFTCWASTRPQASSLAGKLRTAIMGRALPGDSDTFLTFSNQTSNRDQETGLIGEILELRASSKTTN